MSDGERERIARIIHDYAKAWGATVWEWEQASDEMRDDARARADAILDGRVLVRGDGINHGDELEHKGWYGETPSYYGFRFVDEPTTKIINRPMFVVRSRQR